MYAGLAIRQHEETQIKATSFDQARESISRLSRFLETSFTLPLVVSCSPLHLLQQHNTTSAYLSHAMEKTALIVLDLQNGVVGMLQGANVVHTSGYLKKVSDTLTAARRAGVPIIQVVTSFRENYADLSSRNRLMAPVKAGGLFKESDPSTHVHPSVSQPDTDIHVRKHRVSAFHGTDLDVVLRSLGVEKLVLFGLATSGAVLSTSLQAADLDYDIVVLKDLCADTSTDVHDTLVGKVLPKQGTVMSAEEWLAQMGGKA
ncbi:Isochorismatase-like protein [Whalleya microplaca]|nr:Isochorismatase-like protein [Whalleya microplaca]